MRLEDLGKKGRKARRKVLLAATKVVARKGIENASVSEIAKAAKSSRSLVPYYLPVKDDLMLSLIRFIASEAYEFFQTRQNFLDLTSDLPPDLEARILMNFEFFGENPHFFSCFMLFFYRCSYDSVCRKLNTQLVETAVRALAGALPPGLKRRDEIASEIYFRMHSEIQKSFIIDKGEASAGPRPFLKSIERFLEMSEK